MKTILLTILISLFVYNVNGQISKPTKLKLLKIFKSSIHQKSKKKINTDSYSWLICNTDSAFYKSDTLYLYDNVIRRC